MHPSMPVPVGVHFTTEPSGYDLLVLDELPIDLLNVFFGAGEFTALIHAQNHACRNPNTFGIGTVCL